MGGSTDLVLLRDRGRIRNESSIAMTIGMPNDDAEMAQYQVGRQSEFLPVLADYIRSRERDPCPPVCIFRNRLLQLREIMEERSDIAIIPDVASYLTRNVEGSHHSHYK